MRAYDVLMSLTSLSMRRSNSLHGEWIDNEFRVNGEFSFLSMFGLVMSFLFEFLKIVFFFCKSLHARLTYSDRNYCRLLYAVLRLLPIVLWLEPEHSSILTPSGNFVLRIRRQKLFSGFYRYFVSYHGVICCILLLCTSTYLLKRLCALHVCLYCLSCRLS